MSDPESEELLRLATPGLVGYACVALGGALGALGRFALGVFALQRLGAVLWGTLAANLLGCLALGAVAGYAQRQEWDQHAAPRLLLAVGFLGAFTTFSTFSLEVWDLWRRGSPWLALAYLGASIGLGLLCVLLGRGWGLRVPA